MKKKIKKSKKKTKPGKRTVNPDPPQYPPVKL